MGRDREEIRAIVNVDANVNANANAVCALIYICLLFMLVLRAVGGSRSHSGGNPPLPPHRSAWVYIKCLKAATTAWTACSAGRFEPWTVVVVVVVVLRGELPLELTRAPSRCSPSDR